MAPPTVLPEVSPRDDESNESDFMEGDREMSLQGTVIDNECATLESSSADIMAKVRVSSEIISLDLATWPPSSQIYMEMREYWIGVVSVSTTWDPSRSWPRKIPAIDSVSAILQCSTEFMLTVRK